MYILAIGSRKPRWLNWRRNRVAIESEIGEKLLWNPTPEKLDKIIGLFRSVDLSSRDAWPEYCDWLVNLVGRFRKAFVPRIKLLKLNEVTAGHE